MKEEDNDFGFSFIDAEELIQPSTDKLIQLRDMIMPLLNNLKKNPEKDVIQWKGKDRIKKIDDFILKINKHIDS